MSNTQFAILIVVILAATGKLGEVIKGGLTGLAAMVFLGGPIIGAVWLAKTGWGAYQQEAAFAAQHPYCVGFKTDDPSGRIDIIRMTSEDFASWKGGHGRQGGFELFGASCKNLPAPIPVQPPQDAANTRQ